MRDSEIAGIIIVIFGFMILGISHAHTKIKYDNYKIKTEKIHAIKDDKTLLWLVRNYEMKQIDFDENGNLVVERKVKNAIRNNRTIHSQGRQNNNNR